MTTYDYNCSHPVYETEKAHRIDDHSHKFKAQIDDRFRRLRTHLSDKRKRLNEHNDFYFVSYFTKQCSTQSELIYDAPSQTWAIKSLRNVMKKFPFYALRFISFATSALADLIKQGKKRQNALSTHTQTFKYLIAKRSEGRRLSDDPVYRFAIVFLRGLLYLRVFRLQSGRDINLSLVDGRSPHCQEQISPYFPRPRAAPFACINVRFVFSFMVGKKMGLRKVAGISHLKR